MRGLLDSRGPYFFVCTFYRLIQEKEVDLVINLPNQNTKYIKDNYLIRRASIDCGVPLITNLEVSSMQLCGFGCQLSGGNDEDDDDDDSRNGTDSC